MLATSATGQQISLNSLYTFDEIVINPAIAGSKNYTPVNFTFRRQWFGIESAPVTQMLSMHTYVGSNLGLGGFIFNDVTGPTRRTGVNFSAAYHLRLTSDYSHTLSFGIAAVLFQHIYQKDKLITDIPNDIAIQRLSSNELVPDANFGVYYYYKEKAYLGLTAQNLVQSRVDLFNVKYKILNPIERSYYLSGGYDFSLGKDFTLKPSFLLRAMEHTPMQFDITAKLLLKQMFWVGASYRNKDAIVGMLGLTINKFSLGYAYDLPLSDLKHYSSGSHEICLGYYFANESDKKRKNIPWNKRNRLFTPMY